MGEVAALSPLARRLVAVVLGVSALALGSLPVWRFGFDRVRDDGRLAAWVNRRPERLQISWREVRSPWPGRLEITDLRVAGRTPRLRWEVTADAVAGWLSPAQLARRELRFTSIRASGVRVRVEPNPPAGSSGPAAGGAAAAAASPAALPRPSGDPEPGISGFPAGPPPPSPLRAKPWSYSFHDIEVESVSEVRIGDNRFAGSARGRGGFELHRRREAEILPSAIEVAGLSLAYRDNTLASGVDGTLRFHVTPYPYRGAKPADVLPRFVGEIALDGQVDPSEGIAYLTRAWPSLEIDTGVADVSARLRLRSARLGSGSRLQVSARQQKLRFLGFEARGAAELEARVDGGPGGPRLQTELTLAGWELGRPGGAAQMTGDGMRLTTRSTETSLLKPPAGGELELDLGRARVPDLRFLNGYLPAAAGVEVEQGEASINGRFHFTQATGDGAGKLEVRGRGVRLAARGQRLAGDLESEILLSEPDLAAGTFSLAGTQVALRKLTAETSEGDHVRDWWADARLTQGRVDLRPPLALSGDFTAKLADTRPLIAIYEMRRDLADWVERLLTLEGVSATGSFEWTPGRFELDRGFVPLAHGELRARFLLDQGRAGGKLLARWRRLVIGVELAEGERSIKLRDVEGWFGGEASAPPKP
jgi:hypothetical protein